ncbi:MAG: phage integrase SAM-like domain-containing protein, partial [Candidatus Marinimicrobia bacterium]|nr:phage integrase SAM-like domain-containing protein [Candidatus Neomarinimicrobiota bacterium]
MATLKYLKRKNGEAYQIGYSHPRSKRWVRKTIYCSLKDAEKIKKKLEADIALGLFNITNDRMDYTWHALLDRYTKYAKRNKSEKTVRREKNVIDAFNRFLKGDISLSEITNSTIEKYKSKRLKIGRRPATVAIEMRILKTIFYQAVKWEIIVKNPVVGVNIPKEGIVKVRYLRLEEIDLLLRVIQDEGDNDFANLIQAYLNTGARRNELLYPTFSWENVDLKNRKILLNGKGDRKRYVPINGTLLRIFESLLKQFAEAPFMFKPDYVTHRIQQYYKK